MKWGIIFGGLALLLAVFFWGRATKDVECVEEKNKTIIQEQESQKNVFKIVENINVQPSVGALQLLEQMRAGNI